MNLLLISSAPVLVILCYIYIRDKYEKEPIWLLIRSLFLGMLIVVPAVALEALLSRWNGFFSGFSRTAYISFVVAGFSEELLKFTALRLFIWRNKNFNERFDGIVYAVFISLGFAWIENIMYVFQGGADTGMLRAFTAVPAHAMFGVSMGYYFGKAKFGNKINLVFALLIPVLLHGMYDFLVLSGDKLLMLLFIPYMIFLFVRTHKEINTLSA